MRHGLKQSLLGPWQHHGHHTGRTLSAGQCSSNSSSSSKKEELLVRLQYNQLQHQTAVLLLLLAGSWGAAPKALVFIIQ
jgi:hypothetical protein